MNIKLWGVRGSIPCPMDPRLSSSRYGGETICVEVSSPTHTLYIDAGSGIRRVGFELMKQEIFQKGKGEVHIYFTHFHWDHILGLLFFVPIFTPGTQIHLYGVQPEIKNFVHTLFKAPYFPVNYDKLGAKLFYHQLKPRTEVKHGDLSLTPYLLDHPNEAWGYRVEHEGKVYAHCSDTECNRTGKSELGEDIALYDKVDLCFFDSQYLMDELVSVKQGWGHSSPNIGIDMAIAYKIKHILFAHHDPAATDDTIIKLEGMMYNYVFKQMRQFERNGDRFPSFKWEFARQDSEFEL